MAASGKRTLVDVLDEDVAARKRIRPPHVKSHDLTISFQQGSSRFFLAAPSYSPTTSQETAPSSTAVSVNFGSDYACMESGSHLHHDFENESFNQEDGYLSPEEDLQRSSSPSIPSPSRERGSRWRDVDAISSPPVNRIIPRSVKQMAPHSIHEDPDDQRLGLDLRVMFDSESSDIDYFETKVIPNVDTMSERRQSAQQPHNNNDDEIEIDELTDRELHTKANQKVFAGWLSAFAHQSSNKNDPVCSVPSVMDRRSF